MVAKCSLLERQGWARWEITHEKKGERGDWNPGDAGLLSQHVSPVLSSYVFSLALASSRHLYGGYGSTEDPFTASALAADPDRARAGAALLRPGSHVPAVPAAARGPPGDRWQ